MNFSNNRLPTPLHVLNNVAVSVIQYDSDAATRIEPIYAGQAQDVQAKWDKVINAAKQYPYAEQNGFGTTFVNWPCSQYIMPQLGLPLAQTNSNTFARCIIKLAGLKFHEMTGTHPGNPMPVKNETGRYIFYQDQTPWKGGTAKPQPSGNPPPA